MCLGQGFFGNPFHKFLFIMGDGGTGKSSLLKIPETLFPLDMVTTLPDWLIYNTGRSTMSNHQDGLEGIKTAKFAVFSEEPDAEQNIKLNVKVLKNITSHDLMAVRGIYQKTQQIKPYCIPVFVMNRRIALPDNVGNEIKRRIEILDFNVVFDGENAHPSVQMQPDIHEVILKPKQGAAYLRLLLRGIRRCLKYGNVERPQKAKQAINEMMSKQNPFLATLQLIAQEKKGASVSYAQIAKAIDRHSMALMEAGFEVYVKQDIIEKVDNIPHLKQKKQSEGRNAAMELDNWALRSDDEIKEALKQLNSEE